MKLHRCVSLLMIGMLSSVALAEANAEPGAEEAPSDATSAGMTNSQRNAVRSAEDYLSMKGFSRFALIQQLSSDYGAGFSKKDATVAVDSLGIDWNANAARSAREYLDIKGFSCNGLIAQLSSEYGAGYTKAQAQYGAKQSGACN
ncbi:Ltp family lipoprotein [Asaia bogorensis]|uniref:Ltp family lipoprotein n=1 Tax=Asaia bogorensis TaxID=91915 RepID=UPI00197B1A82|nr:Ltp family lipoprotein [Asaia bogorensis]